MTDVPQNQDNFQYLGKKTFWIFVLERSGAVFLILFISIVLFFTGGSGLIPSQIGGYVLNLQVYALYGFIIFALFFALAFFISWLIYINYRYALGEDSLKIRRGILNKEEITIPYRQIQAVNIRRDLSYQILGLSRIIILTAGQEEKNENDEAAGAESEGVLPALDRDVASKLQDELLRRADVQKVVATSLK